MSRFRQRLQYLALGGLLAYSWALYSMRVFFSSFTNVLWFIVSVVLVVALILMAIWVLLKLLVNSKGKFVHLPTLVLLVGIVIVLVVIAAIVTDWAFGPALRSVTHLDALLPSGNLLLSGGRAGWTYLLLYVVFITMLLYDRLVRLWAKLKPSGSKPARPERKSPTSDVRHETITPSH